MIVPFQQSRLRCFKIVLYHCTKPAKLLIYNEILKNFLTFFLTIYNFSGYIEIYNATISYKKEYTEKVFYFVVTKELTEFDLSRLFYPNIEKVLNGIYITHTCARTR